MHKLFLLFLLTLLCSKTKKTFMPLAAGQDLNETYDKLHVKVLNPLKNTMNYHQEENLQQMLL